MRRIIIIVFLCAASIALQAQELRCTVTVNFNKIKGANPATFKAMQAALTQFVNERSWTTDQFSQEERIACNLIIQLDEQLSSNEFKGSIHLQQSRPVYNASYETPLLNIKDENFQVKYSEFEPLVYNELSNTDNLTSIVAFYVYIMLGMDYDSFSPQSGSAFFQQAMQIANHAQNSSYVGWKSSEDESNRYWLAENLTNRAYTAFRRLTYDYHRKGLDVMWDAPNEGRAVVADGILSLLKLYRNRPILSLFEIFFDAKTTELLHIFSESPAAELSRVVDALVEMDPANSSKYQTLKEKKAF